MAAAHAGTALPAHCVNLVNEDNTRRMLFGGVKQIAHTGSAHAHKHLHKIGAANGEKRHSGLASRGLGQQSLARTRRAVKQHAFRNSRAQLIVLFGRFQKVHHLGKLLDNLVNASHILKGGTLFLIQIEPGPAFTKLHNLAAALPLIKHKEQERAD